MLLLLMLMLLLLPPVIHRAIQQPLHGVQLIINLNKRIIMKLLIIVIIVVINAILIIINTATTTTTTTAAPAELAAVRTAAHRRHSCSSARRGRVVPAGVTRYTPLVTCHTQHTKRSTLHARHNASRVTHLSCIDACRSTAAFFTEMSFHSNITTHIPSPLALLLLLLHARFLRRRRFTARHNVRLAAGTQLAAQQHTVSAHLSAALYVNALEVTLRRLDGGRKGQQ